MRSLVTSLFIMLLAFSINAQTSGYALNFAGDVDNVVFGGSVATTATDNVTLECWVKWAGSNAANQVILYNGTTGSNGYGITIDGSNSNVSLHVGAPSFQNAGTISVGSWTHLAIVRNGGNWTLYINGNGTAVGSAAPSTPTGNFKVGNNESVSWGFQGVIDEVRVSNTARYTSNFTPSNSPFSTDGSTTTLYHFDEGSGQSTNDESSSNNDGQLGQTGSAEGTDPTWVLGDAPLPVLVYSFNAKYDHDKVTMNWHTSPITEQEIFTVQRAIDQTWVTIGTVFGDPGNVDNFSFTDDLSSLSSDQTSVRYRVSFTNPQGQTDYSPVQVVTVKRPQSIWLAQNHPNPFNPGTQITYALDEQNYVKLTVYNALGQLVQTLVDQNQSAGEYSVQFNGSSFPGGVYFYKLETNNRSVDIKKMILLK